MASFILSHAFRVAKNEKLKQHGTVVAGKFLLKLLPMATSRHKQRHLRFWLVVHGSPVWTQVTVAVIDYLRTSQIGPKSFHSNPPPVHTTQERISPRIYQHHKRVHRWHKPVMTISLSALIRDWYSFRYISSFRQWPRVPTDACYRSSFCVWRRV